MSWNIEALPFPFPPSISKKILNIPLAFGPYCSSDSIYWKHTVDGSFSLKSTYRSINNENTNDANHNWIWKCFGNMREKFFIWKTYNKGLPTTLSLYNKNITTTPLCPICKLLNETIIHILRDCSYANAIWSNYQLPLNFHHLDVRDWLLTNATKNDKNKLNISWSAIFLFTVHNIWLARNNNIFAYTPLPNQSQLANLALSRAVEFWSNFSIDKLVLNPPNHPIPNRSHPW